MCVYIHRVAYRRMTPAAEPRGDEITREGKTTTNVQDDNQRPGYERPA